MPRRKTKEEFIQEAVAVHGTKYDYSLVDYVNNRTKVTIVCPTHGKFSISPAGHVCMEYGCIECGGTRKRTTAEFIQQANILHNYRYDYSKTTYVNQETPIVINCSVHGDYTQTPFGHLHSFGCRECGIVQRTITKIETGLIPPDVLDKTAYEVYYQQVRRITNRSYKQHKEKINPLNLKRAHQNANHLDHIYSIVYGFHNNVPPEVIGHWTNLRMTNGLDNLIKNSRCNKTLEQLYEDYNLIEGILCKS